MTDPWQKWRRKVSSSNGPPSSPGKDPDETVQYIPAEIEFFAYIQQRIDEGEVISMDGLHVNLN